MESSLRTVSLLYPRVQRVFTDGIQKHQASAETGITLYSMLAGAVQYHCAMEDGIHLPVFQETKAMIFEEDDALWLLILNILYMRCEDTFVFYFGRYFANCQLT